MSYKERSLILSDEELTLLMNALVIAKNTEKEDKNRYDSMMLELLNYSYTKGIKLEKGEKQ